MIFKEVYPIARCVKAENHDLGVVFMEQIILDGSQRGPTRT